MTVCVYVMVCVCCPQLPRLQAAAHSHGQAEALDQDPRAQDKVSAEVRLLLYLHHSFTERCDRYMFCHSVFQKVLVRFAVPFTPQWKVL